VDILSDEWLRVVPGLGWTQASFIFYGGTAVSLLYAHSKTTLLCDIGRSLEEASPDIQILT